MHPENATSSTAKRAAPHRLISAERVQGTPVFSREGDKVGHIEDVMLDKTSGKVAYAIMSHGGILGAGERYQPLPWSMLHYDTEKQGYVTPFDKAHIEDAPNLDQTEIYGEDAWAEIVHSHYGTPAPFI